MNCEKCQDRGFIELDGIGLRNQLCDCEKAREVAERNGLPWREKVESVAQASNNFLEIERRVIASEEVKDGNSNSRIRQSNKHSGSADTGKSKQPKKPKAGEKSRARAS